MKDKKIKKSLDKITPTKEEKSIMLENILSSQQKKNLDYRYVIRFSACLIIMIILVSANPFNLSDGERKQYPIIKATMSINNFCYDDNCYMATNEQIPRHELGNYLFTISDENNELDGCDVYRYKDNKLIVDTGINYQIYTLYKEEE